MDLLDYRSTTPPVFGRAAITMADDGSVRDPGDRAAWREWVSASKTRNWLRREPLLDWLDEHGAAKGFAKDAGADADPPSPYDLRSLLFSQGNKFEERIFGLLEARVASHLKVSTGWEETRSLAAAERTFEAMCAGVELIEQAVVRNPESRTYGAIDLLVRSDALERLFPGTLTEGEERVSAPGLTGADGAAKPWHYVVVDVKFSTLDLSVNGYSGSSHRHYAGQVLVYTAAIARLQGYCPREAYLLGRTWTTTKGRGSGALDRLGRVPIDRDVSRDSGRADATPLAVEVARAVEWVRLMRAEGANWSALPRPSRPELYPNLNNDQDQPWSEAKRRIADEIGELTALPGVGPELRDAAIARGITGRFEPGLSAERLEVGGDVRPRRLSVVLAANAPERAAAIAADPSSAVIPATINLGGDDEHEWRAPYALEFFVDFENTQNLDDDFSALPAVGGNPCIFQVGCLVKVRGRTPTADEIAAARASGADPGERLVRGDDASFAQWTAARLAPSAERAVLDAWLTFMGAWRTSLGLEWDEARIVHWSPAEPNLLTNSHNSALDRHPNWRLPADLGWFDALDRLVHRVPLGVAGAWGFGLKQIAKGMHRAGLIATVWGDGPADGLGAMAAAYEAERRAAADKKRLADYDFIRAGAEYNEVDCRAMAEIVAWLRANR